MRLSRLVLLLALPGMAATAKPWNGIIPGTSSGLDVIARFGEPSKTLTAGGKQTLVYSGKVAIKATTQAQFKLGPDKTVERIDVYPAVVIDVAAIEKSYGPACELEASSDPCFVRKQTPQQRPYYVYAKLGLAVFFQGDGRTVQSLAFLPGT